MVAALFFGLVLAQTSPAESGDAALMARIRKALAVPPAIETTRAERGSRPVFRLDIRGRKPDNPLWDDWSAVPSYIRPSYPLYHAEFLQQVTPEFVRASVLYPGYVRTPYSGYGIGIPIMPILQALSTGSRATSRRLQQERAREEVRQALEDLQNAKDQEVRTIVKSGVELRMVTVNVRGKDGGPPRNLAQADFTILEDGVRQTVTVFVKNTDNPKSSRYQLGYQPTPSKPGETKHIEIRVRGIHKKITHDFVTR